MKLFPAATLALMTLGPGTTQAGYSGLEFVARSARVDPTGRALAAYVARPWTRARGVPRSKDSPIAGYDACAAELENGQVIFDSNSVDTLRVEGIPPTCMSLAESLIGFGGNPQAQFCGSDCLLYEGLTEAQLQQIEDIVGK